MKNIYNRFGVNKKTFPTLLTSLVIVFSLFFTSGFAAHAQADEVVSPVEQTISTETSATEDVVVTEEPAVVIEEVVVPVVEEPSTPIVEDVTSVVEEVVAPNEEQAPAPAPVVVTTPPALSTEKEDYHPGQTATIFGKFFAPFQNFVLKIFGSDDNNENYTESTQTITADANGNFSTNYTLDSLFRPFYEMVASDFNGTQLASSWFRDSAVSVYSQCSNDDGDGYATGDQGCRWVNGALNPQNSTYQEGDSTVQRVLIEGLAPGPHTITFQYGTTKGGKHAYDYLTSPKTSETWVDEADLCQGMSNCVGTTEVYATIPTDPVVPPAFVPQPAGRQFALRGALNNAIVSIPTNASGSYAGDSETEVTVTFEVPTTGPMCNVTNKGTFCAVAMWFGAHVAQTTEWSAYDGTTGAGGINGAPYHVAITRLDSTSIGQRDNQMQADTIVIPTKATLTLIKNVVNDNGGAASASNWTLSATGGPTPIFGVSGSQAVTSALVDAGTYTLSESTGPAGYQASSYSCVVNNASPISGNSITLNPDDVAVCTITNNDQPATLIVKKIVNNGNTGATKTASDFSFSINNASAVAFESDGQNDNTVNAGTYTVTEPSVAGYTTTYDNCSNVVVPNGGTATCTITNTAVAPTLTLVKTVVNDNGGTATSANFQAKIDGNNVSWSIAIPVSAGAHTASETTLPTYTAGVWGGDCAANGSVTLALGENKTCTITNDDIAPKLHLRKVVVNDNGGTKTVANFTLTANGTGANDISGTSPVDSAAGLKADTFALSETNMTGYTASAWSCVGGTQNGSNITLGLNEEATCTITNNDIAPQLTVIKHVINDNGGSATAGNFTMNVAATNPSDASFAGDETGTTITLDAGTYSVDESAFAGYTKTLGANCSGTIAVGESKTCTITNDDQQAYITVTKVVTNDNGGLALPGAFNLTLEGNPVSSGVQVAVNPGTYTAGETLLQGYAFEGFTGDCDANGDVTVALGQSRTCILTNNDIAPSLTLVKTVVNNNGGTAVATDWTLTASGPTPVSGAGGATSGATFNAGTYTLSESAGPAGYSASAWSCVGGTQNGSSITLGLGQSATCTITNDDIAPKLHLRKVVVNDNGGTKTVANFTLTANGTGANDISGTSPVDSTAGLKVDTFALSETNMTGYTASAWSCEGGTQNGSNITLGLNEEATCTITNDDQPGHVIVHKVTSPADTTTQFPITISGTYPVAGASQNIVGGGSVDYTVNAGTYGVTETVPAGWDQTGNTCTGVVVANGETKECTITNVQRGHLIVEKTTFPTGDTTSFSINATTGNGTISGSVSGSVTDATNKDYEVTPGTYSVTETVPTGWEQTSNACTNVAVAAGETKTCVITNTKLAKITIIKDAQPNDATDFAFTTTGTGLSAFSLDDDEGVLDTDNATLSNTKVFSDVKPGSYSVTEGALGQYWTLKDISCVGGVTSRNGSTINITANPGDEVICTFVNEKLSPTRTQGFWQTHTDYTSGVFWRVLGGNMPVGSSTVGVLKTISTTTTSGGVNKLFGAYFSNIAKKTDNKQRTALEKARMQLLQQLVTAKLNCAAFGCVDSVKAAIATADSAYAGTSVNAIITSAGILDTYNNSGDTIIIGNAGKATPSASKALADLIFWN